MKKDGASGLALRRISSGISLLVTSESTSVFRVKYSDLLGYSWVNKSCAERRTNIPFFHGIPCSLGERS